MLGYRVGRNARKCHLLAIAILENVVRAALVSEACRLPHFFCVSVDCRRERVCMYLRVRSYTFFVGYYPDAATMCVMMQKFVNYRTIYTLFKL